MKRTFKYRFYPTRKQDSPSFRNGGFTVVEMVVVILVLATLATIAFSSFKAIETAKINKTVTEIDTLRKIVDNYVRANSLVTYQNVTLSNMAFTDPDARKFWDGGPKNINPWGGSYNVTSVDPFNTYIITVTSLPDDVGGNISSVYQNGAKSVSFSGGTLTLEFN